MGKRLDLTGKRFGRLIALNLDFSKTDKTYWLCQCDCGKRKIVATHSLTNGLTKSCGCLQKEITIGNLYNKRYNAYDLSGEHGIGYTSKGEPFYFDLEDYEKIKDYCWRINENGYVVYKIKNKIILFHKIIMPNKEIVDHINHNTFDNRKCNLRYVTGSQNQFNRKRNINNVSGVSGVIFHKRDKKWQAQIKINNKQLYLGSFDSFNDAVKARKEAEEEYFGKYSYDNSMKNGGL